MKHAILAGIIRETLLRSFDVGINVLNVTCDGANVSAMEALGAKIMTGDVHGMVSKFKHPSEGADYDVSVYLDPIHMLKLIRTTLADYKCFFWKGHGYVRWCYIERLHELQETHGLRLGGNKLTKRHVNFRRNKMKAALAFQVSILRIILIFVSRNNFTQL